MANNVNLTWQHGAQQSDPVYAPEFYDIYRGMSGGAKTLLSTVAGTILTYTDQDVPAGVLCYEIEPRTTGPGVGPRSNEDCTAPTPGFQTIGTYRPWPAGHVSWETWLGRQVTYSSDGAAMGANGFTQLLGLWSPGGTKYEDWKQLTRITLALIWDLVPNGYGGGPEWANVQAGVYDTEITTFGTNLVAMGHSHALLRLNHEGDSPNVSWTFTGGNAADYIGTWRHVHGVMMAVPGANFKWQYSLNGPAGFGNEEGGTPLTELGYPGDAYVDQVAIGNYDRDPYNNNWPGIEAKLNLISDFARSKGKLFSMPETGCWITPDTPFDGGGDNPSWVQNTFDWVQNFEQTYPGSMGYHLYYDNLSQVTLSQFPNAEALYKSLHGSAPLGMPVIIGAVTESTLVTQVVFTIPGGMTIPAGSTLFGDLSARSDGPLAPASISVTDSKNGAWTNDAFQFSTEHVVAGAYRFDNSVELVAGDTITASWTNGGRICMGLSYVQGLDPTNPLDVPVAEGSGDSTTYDSGNMATTVTPNVLLRGCVGHRSDLANATVPAGYTELFNLKSGTGNNAGISLSAGYQIVSSTGIYNYSGPISTAFPWCALLRAYK